MLRKAPDIVTRKVEDKTFLMPLRSGDEGWLLYELNDVAVFLWNQIDGKNTENEIAQALMNEHDVPKELALADTQEFLADLKGIGAVI